MNANYGLELRKFVAPEFVYGEGALNLIGSYAKKIGTPNSNMHFDHKPSNHLQGDAFFAVSTWICSNEM